MTEGTTAALHQLGEGCSKKAVFQGTLNYLKRLQQPPSVRQGQKSKMQILIR